MVSNIYSSCSRGGPALCLSVLTGKGCDGVCLRQGLTLWELPPGFLVHVPLLLYLCFCRVCFKHYTAVAGAKVCSHHTMCAS